MTMMMKKRTMTKKAMAETKAKEKKVRQKRWWQCRCRFFCKAVNTKKEVISGAAACSRR